MRRALATLGLVLACFGCSQETGRLTLDQERRLAAQGITRRASNLTFRHTRGAGARWDQVRASIVVTRETVLIHRNGEIEFLDEPRSRRRCEVHRDHDRVRVGAGSGMSAEAWSFAPADDPQGWATDIRRAIRGRGSRLSDEASGDGARR